MEGPTLPAAALELYENLRAAMLKGQSCMGAVAIAFHGMWRGLHVLSIAPASEPAASTAPMSLIPTATHDRQLVRLLANMVLATQSQDCHAY